jgi:hypothetical protein
VLDIPHTDRGAIDTERPVNRITLRHILLEGLGDIAHFGKKLTSFDDAPNGAIAARFEDGSEAVGDVLVGADGANSRLRSLLLPGAARAETGIWAVRGKVPLNGEVRASVPPAILRGPTLILGSNGCFLFCGTVQYDDLEIRQARGDRVGELMWGCAPMPSDAMAQ